ncbi:Putative protein C9orf85 like protein [Chelonia mydas]|uniref:Uncharacterized protein n=1 Tax=Chelonia mydas TaxID=8469 RepID=M7BE72_CHEMY|nr:Putative protein C9orf85 like protein [Chelonia mydas]
MRRAPVSGGEEVGNLSRGARHYHRRFLEQFILWYYTFKLHEIWCPAISCACELEVCAKCGKKEEIVVPISKGPEKTENETTGNCQRTLSRRDESEERDELDFDIDLDGMDDKNPDMLEEHFKNMKFERTEI